MKLSRLRWSGLAWATLTITLAMLGSAFFYLGHTLLSLESAEMDDVCGTRSVVAVESLAMHGRPSGYSSILLTLKEDQMVNVCLESGIWSGVILADPSEDCAIPYDSVNKTAEYLGPCRSGWVRSESLRMFAG